MLFIGQAWAWFSFAFLGEFAQDFELQHAEEVCSAWPCRGIRAPELA
jgi:hypothetical protein